MERRADKLLLGAGVVAAGWWAAKHMLRARRRLDLRGKTVLITGGSRGLGLVLAREFSTRGAKVAVCARDRAELERAAAEFAERGAPFAALLCDVTQRAQVEVLAASVEQRLGPVDVLVNNAGTITVGPFETMTAVDFEEAFALHVWAPLFTSWAVLPGMRERGGGRIVNISSIGGKIPVPHLAPYCASKHALVGLSGCMRAELAKDGVLVTTVCPGLMRTGSPRNVGVRGNYQQEYAWFAVGDSLPGASMAVERAARQIVEAAIHGDAEAVLSFPAKAATRLHAVAPEVSAELLALQNGLLPRRPAQWDSGEGIPKRRGYESESAVTRSPLTVLTRQAALANNENGRGVAE